MEFPRLRKCNMEFLREDILKEFRKIPGVGKEIAKDLWKMGYRSAAELIDEDPEEMYERLCEIQGERVDPCMQYVFRCAVYYCQYEEHDPALLNWWNWKDLKISDLDKL